MTTPSAVQKTTAAMITAARLARACPRGVGRRSRGENIGSGSANKRESPKDRFVWSVDTSVFGHWCARAIRTIATIFALLTIALTMTEALAQLIARTTMRLTPHRARLERTALLSQTPSDSDAAPAAGAAGTIHRSYVD